MNAIVIGATEKGRAPRLRWATVPDPECGDEEVIVSVAATAVNRADLLQARGLYPAPPDDSPILGLELAGTIAAKGTGVSGWQIGDRVCALAPGGGYAQKARVHQQMLLRMPDDWAFAQAAAVPEAWLTAFSNLIMEAGLSQGERTLIHAGASGVGTAGLQIAKEAGAQVFVTVGNDQKAETCRLLGADGAILYKETDFANALMAMTDGQGVDIILDCVGGPNLARHLKLLRPNGRMVTIGLLGGRRGELDMAALLGKSLTLKGTRLRARPQAQKIAINEAFRQQLWPKLCDGYLKVLIDSTYPITAVAEAHAHVQANRNIGKVVLKIT
jgi:putative PIG3 family NAD(P)H quinone oxidoreductase